MRFVPLARDTLLGVFALLALALAAVGRHPYLIAMRGDETLIAVGIAGGVLLALRFRKSSGEGREAWRWILALLAVAALGLAARNELRWAGERREVFAGDASVAAVAPHFIVGYRHFDEVAPLAAQGLIGGVYLSRANVAGRSAADLAGEIASLQSLRREARLPPLIVAVDQEGGLVAHLSPPLRNLPSLSTFAGGGDAAEQRSRARAQGQMQGRELAGIGVTMNFSPVVDLAPEGTRARLDTHTRLHERAISAHPDTVVNVAGGYLEGLRLAGVRGTLKHFPGLAKVGVDTHHLLGELSVPRQQLEQRDWRPFRALIDSGAAIMVAHVVLTEVDANAPASMSSKVIGGVLRGQWKFDGLLVTDDLNMGAVFNAGIGKAAASALRAGVDLVLVSYDPDQYYPAVLGAARAHRKGLLDAEVLAASRRRIGAAALAP